MMFDINALDINYESVYKKAIEYRRHFHQYPELSFEEFETSKYIAEKLISFGYDVKTNVGGTGVIAVLRTNKEGKSIAFRADMDALPMLEETGLPFASKRVGIMHACGHDCHMAIVLATAEVLSGYKESLGGTIKFIFQHGEEANGGAKCIINDGGLRNPDVDEIYGLHVMPDIPVGSIALKSGYLSATDDEFYIRIHGRSAHSSEPEIGVNAIVIASQIITALATILWTNISPYDIATYSICKISGGEAINVIPDYAEISGMIRCVEKENKMAIRSKMVSISENISKSMGGSAEVEFIPGFPSVNNDSELTQVVIEASEKALKSPEDIILIDKPHLGSEDFAYYQEEIPGVMFMLGCENAICETGTLHSPILNVNEESLLYGIKIFLNIAFMQCGL